MKITINHYDLLEVSFEYNGEIIDIDLDYDKVKEFIGDEIGSYETLEDYIEDQWTVENYAHYIACEELAGVELKAVA